MFISPIAIIQASTFSLEGSLKRAAPSAPCCGPRPARFRRRLRRRPTAGLPHGARGLFLRDRAVGGSGSVRLGVTHLGDRLSRRSLLGPDGGDKRRSIRLRFLCLAAHRALAGSVNPSASAGSFFVPVEHAVLTRESADVERTRAFARYSFVGGLAGAVRLDLVRSTLVVSQTAARRIDGGEAARIVAPGDYVEIPPHL